jgi:putative DNA methylase
MNDTATQKRVSGVKPYSLKDAPALIERVFPAQKISVEAQKERKAVQSQVLTGLGSYWKGRKPLALCRAIVLGGLLPATGDDENDLKIYEKLLAVHDDSFGRRSPNLSAWEVAQSISAPDATQYFVLSGVLPNRDLHPLPLDKDEYKDARISWRRDINSDVRAEILSAAIRELPFEEKVRRSYRPEECNQEWLFQPIWSEVNTYLGTNARSITQLVEQLGIMRFGRRPVAGDTFCGGGSVPFEAARMGCNVYASDLNPVGCMLTWGAMNIVGGDEATKRRIEEAQRSVTDAVDKHLERYGIEHDEEGNRPKAFLYCLETTCPQTGWNVPLSPSWVVSKSRNVIVRLVPDRERMRFDFEVATGVSDAEMREAEQGTVQSGDLVLTLDGETYRTPLRSIRGDSRDENGNFTNSLRRWGFDDVSSRNDDIFRERLYCIQWIDRDDLDRGKKRARTWFAAPTDSDLRREELAERIVHHRIDEWRNAGLLPTMRIESGYNTNQPIRERGWQYWHQFFPPRTLCVLALYMQEIKKWEEGDLQAALTLQFAKLLDWVNKGCYYGTGAARESISHLFSNQALNTLFNYGIRGNKSLSNLFVESRPCFALDSTSKIETIEASEVKNTCATGCSPAAARWRPGDP